MKYCHAKIFPALLAAFLPLLCAAGIELTSPACDSEVALFRSDWREQIALRGKLKGTQKKETRIDFPEKVVFSFRSSQKVSQAVLEISRDRDFKTLVRQLPFGDSSSLSVANLEIGRKYFWRVRCGKEHSDIWSFSTRSDAPRFLAVPGGSPGNFRDFGGRVTLDGKREFHNHNDVGNFVLVQNDKTLLIDAGQPRYNMDSFHSGKSFQNKLRSSYGHQVPVCDGKLQLSGFESRGIVRNYDGNGAILDITAPYRHTTLENLLRQVDFDRAKHQVTVSDSANFAEEAEFAVPLVTFGQWEEVEPGMLRIFRKNEWEFFCKVSASGEYEISDELIDDDILFDEPVRRILFTFKNKAKDFKISTTFILEEKQ